jgi:hypothetical protein
MKKILAKIFRTIVLLAMAGGVFAGSLYYELNYATTAVVQKQSRLEIVLPEGQQVEVQRETGNQQIDSGQHMQNGDLIVTGGQEGVLLKFSGDGQLRLDKFSRLEVGIVDETHLKFSFRLLEGRAWLMNAYSNADVNIFVDGAVILPGQSVMLVTQIDGKSDIYAHSMDAVVGFLSDEKMAEELLSENSTQIINSMYLPQGTMVSVYGDKVRQNRSTIAKLLFSKLVKEFNYSAFDKNLLVTDAWLSQNLLQDQRMRVQIRDFRLQNIRTRGLKYSSLGASNYHIDEGLREIANLLTFSESKVAKRNLEALYDLLYDAQYLYDFGRREEAQERLERFTGAANQLFLLYGDELKNNYIERVQHEYEYLSFAIPGDALFDLKTVLQQVYLDSIRGQSQALDIQYAFLTGELNSVGYYADNNQGKNLKTAYDGYIAKFKQLLEANESQLAGRLTLIQRQNQAMDNLFMQYPALYRQGYFTDKLFVENKYLSLLPDDANRLEEIQSVISRRIDFLTRLQKYYLDGDVPLQDAQNILALLFSEIARIELPADYQVAVKDLFQERLEDFGLFSRFLSSQEYVSSALRGATPRERFERFKLDNTEEISLEQLQQEMSKQAAEGGLQYELGRLPPLEELEPEFPPINEEQVIVDMDGEISIIENELESSPQVDTVTPVRVPRVRPSS